MEKSEIENNIKQAVLVFKETLENTYLKGNRPFYGIGVHKLPELLCGKIALTRLRNGNMKISGEIGKDAINEKCDGLPRKFEDWDIFPLAITLFNVEFKDGKKVMEETK